MASSTMRLELLQQRLLQHLREQVRIFFLHPFIGARGRHGELEVGIFAHEVEHALEGVADNFHGLRPGPEPCHVDVRVANGANRELL